MWPRSLIISVLMLVVAACGPPTRSYTAPLPDLARVPHAASPISLQTTMLPGDDASVTTMWKRLPGTIDGYARGTQAGDPLTARYGEDKRLAIMNDTPCLRSLP